jgi:hypothetical protein
MSHGCWRIKPSEVERTLKSIQKAGLHVRTVEVGKDGTIRIDVAKTGEPNPADETSETLRKLI